MTINSNTAILVDYDNVFISMEQYYRDFSQPLLPYTVIQSIRDHYMSHNILLTQLYVDLQNIKIGYWGYEKLNTCDVTIHHVAKGRNSSDIVLMLDCMKILQQFPHIKKIVIVSSDSDMTPICKECRLRGVSVEIIYTQATVSPDYVKKLSQLGIDALALESVLQVNTINPNINNKELFAYIIRNKEYLQAFVRHINDIIRATYEKYFRQDKYGQIYSVGAMSLASLNHHIKDKRLVPDFLTNKTTNISLIVDTMVDCGLIIPVEYKIKDHIFETWILSPVFLQNYSCTVENPISIQDFGMFPNA